MRSHQAIAALFIAALIPAPAASQSQLPRPQQLPPAGGQAQPPQRAPQQAQPPQRGPQQAQPQQQQVAPASPYKPVAIGAPPVVNDSGFAAFRKQVEDIAGRKDRAGLARLVVAQDFFWAGEKGDRADKRKRGIDNLTAALSLNSKDGSGWDMLAGLASDPTAMPLPDRANVICGPADPVFDGKELENLARSTGTEEGDWGYPVQAGVEVRASPQPNAPAIEKLGMHFIRVMPDDNFAGDEQNPMLRVVTPSGKVGFVPADAISPMGSDQLCYTKDAGGAWKIAGFIGGEQ